ncbi:MAG: Hpt domain-containing protein [Hyphomicrobiaceae bacterium]|nr:Hpt domain-containing protein [Hyphomicrobiaceae bacterium]
MSAVAINSQTCPVASRPDASRPVDLVHLAHQTLGDRALETEILKLFLVQSELLMKRLAAGFGDAAVVRRNAHTLKGSASGIGAFEVASDAEALFDAPGDAVQSDRLGESVARANAFIRSLLD